MIFVLSLRGWWVLPSFMRCLNISFTNALSVMPHLSLLLGLSNFPKPWAIPMDVGLGFLCYKLAHHCSQDFPWTGCNIFARMLRKVVWGLSPKASFWWGLGTQGHGLKVIGGVVSPSSSYAMSETPSSREQAQPPHSPLASGIRCDCLILHLLLTRDIVCLSDWMTDWHQSPCQQDHLIDILNLQNTTLNKHYAVLCK